MLANSIGQKKPLTTDMHILYISVDKNTLNIRVTIIN